MSLTSEDFKLKAYPTFRLYTKPGTFEEFTEDKLDLLSLKKFLKKNHVNGFFDLEVANVTNPELLKTETPLVSNPLEFPKQVDQPESLAQIKK